MNKKQIAYVCYTFAMLCTFLIFIVPNLLWMFLAFIFWGIGIYNIQTYQRDIGKSTKNYIEKLKNEINYDDISVSTDYLQGIFIQTEKERIGILSRENSEQEFNIEYINFTDISDVHLIQNDSTVIKSVKGDLIGKSLIGGALLGGTGAVIGAVSANRNVNEVLNKLTLQIVVDDVINPIRNIKLINLQQGISKNSSNYEFVFDVVDKWYKRIELIIKKKENKKAM